MLGLSFLESDHHNLLAWGAVVVTAARWLIE
jgi:hypothetical protein